MMVNHQLLVGAAGLTSAVQACIMYIQEQACNLHIKSTNEMNNYTRTRSLSHLCFLLNNLLTVCMAHVYVPVMHNIVVYIRICTRGSCTQLDIVYYILLPVQRDRHAHVDFIM